MPQHALAIIALFAPLCVCISCSTTVPQPAGTSPATRPTALATSRPTTPTTSASSIPLIYDPRLNPAPLELADVEEILSFVRQYARTNQPIWYIHVHSVSVHDGKKIWIVSVFFTPEQSLPRIRKGKCLYMESYVLRLWPKVAQYSNISTDRELQDYVQVSLPDHPFTERLTLPDRPTWPFECPAGFSDGDVVALADLVHGPPPTFPREYGPYLVKADEPVYRIARDKGGLVLVETGSMQGPLAGIGSYLRCRKEIGRWIIVDFGRWVS